MNPLKALQHFLMAIQFYSRIPVPFDLNWREESLNKATAYFPLVGALLASILCGLLWALNLIFQNDLAVLITLSFSVLLTGAFHEDGFADYCDGVGGGWSRSDKLKIMKDSRIGTYGGLGLLIMFLLRWQTLSLIPNNLQYYALFIGMIWSRWSATLIMITLRYQREEGTAKPLAKGLRYKDFFLGSLWAWLALIVPGVESKISVIIALFALLFAAIIFRLHMKIKIGGYTGDALGATQQITEVFYYLGLLAIWNLF